jgi:hypothetical protein
MGHGLLLWISFGIKKSIVEPAHSRIASKKGRKGKLLRLRQPRHGGWEERLG